MMNDSSLSTDKKHSAEPMLSRRQTIGLALFALSLTTLFALYGPYTILILAYGNHLEDAPPEFRNLSGPGVMGIWGITGVAFWLLLLTGKAYFFRSKSAIENLAVWSTVMTVLSALSFLTLLYGAIRHDIRLVLGAGVMLVIGLYQALIVWLLSIEDTPTADSIALDESETVR